MLVQTTLFGTVLQEKTIYDHPKIQYEQFIERYYGRHKSSGKSKATVICFFSINIHHTIDQCLEFHISFPAEEIKRCDVMGGSNNVTMTLFWKKQFGDAPQ